MSGTYTNNKIVLASGSSGTNTLAGATLAFAGSGAGIYQIGGGMFIISNSVVLTADTVLRGPGLGAVVLASNITGSGQLTVQGAFNVTLLGSNTFMGPVLMNSSNGGTLTLASNFALGTNSLTISNGVVIGSVASAYLFGNGISNQSALVTGSSSTWTNTAGFVIGNGKAVGNSVTLDSTGHLFASTLVIGTNGATGNSLLITNGGSLSIAGASIVGLKTSSNTLLVVGSGGSVTSLWNLANQTVTVGSGTATGNLVRVDGGGVFAGAQIFNGRVVVGTNGAVFNTLLLTNGGIVSVTSASSVGFNASSNTVVVSGGGVWNNHGTSLNVGGGIATDDILRIDNGGIVTNGAILVGNSPSGRSIGNLLIVTNGGKLFTTGANSDIGSSNGSGNTGLVTGVGSLWNGGGAGITVGDANNSSSNVLWIDNGGLLNNVGTLWVGLGTGANSNKVVVTNGAAIAAQTIGVGGLSGLTGNQLIISGGATVTVTTALLVTNTGNSVAFNGGLLSVANTVYSNGADFVVGDGIQFANFRSVAGTQLFQNNLVVTNNGVLTGTGTILLTGATGATIIKSGGLLSPGIGAGPAALTNTGTLEFDGGGSYLFEVNSFAGGATAGLNPGWDTVQVNGVLTNAGSALNKFVINVTSLNLGNTPGLANGFDKDGTFNLILATASTVAAFDASAYSLVLTNFANPYDGSWNILQQGNNVVLSYQGGTNFVWNNISGLFSNTSGLAGANWRDQASPPTSITNVVMYFGGAIGDAAYTASNNLTGLVTKRIVLTNNSAFTQTIAGNAITFGGLAPEIQQNGANGFVISNALGLATNTTVRGAGAGDLALDGSISGAYSLTKTGQFALVLGGANTYTGSTIVDGGTLTVANDNALGTSTQLVVNATVVLAGGAPTVRRLTGAGSVIASNGAALTINDNALGSTFAGVISGDGSVTKVGVGILTLSGANLYTGDTVGNGGTILISGSVASTNLIANSSGAIVWANSLAATNLAHLIINSGGTIAIQSDGTVATVTGNGTLNLATLNTLQVGFGDASSVFGGSLAGAGTVSQVGAGTFTVAGNGSIGTLVANNGWLTVSNGTVGVVNAGANSAVIVNNGATFEMDGTVVVIASNLIVNVGGQVALNSGTLVLSRAAFSNGQDWVVGNGTGAAALYVAAGGVLTLQNNLVITNQARLKGNGTVVVAGGQGNVIIQSGGVLAPGNSPGTLTIVGTNVWQSGGSYQFEVNNFAGNVGTDPGWDWVNVLGVLTNAATSANPFVIDLTSLTLANSPGAAANFNDNSTYSLLIATATNVANFDVSSLVLSTAHFQTPFDGVFALSLQNGTNIVLTYTGIDGYTWRDASGNFSTGASWLGNAAPPVNITNVVLHFGGSTSTGYTASNDLVGLVTKLITLTNSSSTVQTLTGNRFTLAGLVPEVDQNASGAFLIGNDLVLATNTLMAGSGSGTVTWNGNISGPGTLTKQGSWTLVLGGSNSYSGITLVSAGKLVDASVYGLSGSTLSNLVAGAVTFSNINLARLGGLAGSVNLGLTNTTGGGVALVVGGNGQTTIYDGVLSGDAGSVVKTGTGGLTLRGVNTYGGGTEVDSGTLVVSAVPNGIGGAGSGIGTGTVTLAGGTLRFGIGTLLRVTNAVNGVVVLNGGTLAANEFVNQGHVASVGNTTTITSDLLNLTGGFLNVTGGLVIAEENIYNSGIISNTNLGTLRAGQTGTGVITNTGTIALANGSVVAGLITNNGTVLGYGSVMATLYNNQLVLATNNGVLQLQNTALGTGTYQAAGGATLSFNGGATISSLVTTGGTIQIVSSTVTNNGEFDNAGTLVLVNGTYQTPRVLTNGPSATINGYGTLISAATLVNQGTILALVGGQLVLKTNVLNNGLLGTVSGSLRVEGVLTNNGTLLVSAGNALYLKPVLNNGAWLADPTSVSLLAANYVVTTNGYVYASGGSEMIFRGNLVNQSTNKVDWNTFNTVAGTNTVGTGAQFLFSGSSVTMTQLFETPWLLLTGGCDGTPDPSSNGVQDVTSFADVTGFDNNFGLGQLWLTNTTLELAQAVPGPTQNALFVNDLYLFGSSKLVISNNLDVYFVNSNGWAMTDVTLLGNAQIHQLNALNITLSVVPEPNVLLMWLSGAMTLWAARRRRRRKPVS